MTTNNSILVSSVRSNKSQNNVWAVYVQGQEENKSYCKSPYKAMRYAFFLKKQTGCRIADNSLALLSLEIKLSKEAAMTPEQKEAKKHVDEVVEQIAEEHSVNNVLTKADEAKRKRRSKKSEAAPAEAEPAKTKAKRQRKPSTKKAKKEVAE